jgi:uncharacterized protein involved in response to NO
MLNIENKQVMSRIPLFNLGFRPFFLGAAVFAIIAIVLWMAMYVFGWKLQVYGLPPAIWHAHEMIFGYAMAVIAGFLLAAVKNWTNIQTPHGLPLFLLFLLWALARAMPLFGESIPIEVIAILDNLFLTMLFISVAVPVIKTKQWKNISIISKLLLMLASNVVFYLGVLGMLEHGIRWGLYSGLYLILALIFTMGRRVIPFFIEKGVGYSVQVKNWKWLDISSLVLFLLFWIVDILTPDTLLVALLSVILFLLHSMRMVGWYTKGIWQKPLLWVLYLAYGFLVIGFALKAAVFVFDISPYLAVHAFTFGGISLMTMGMMSRVSLGHTGRNISEPPAVLFWMFIIMFVGAVFRVLFPLIDPSHYQLWIFLSQVFWIISFSLFLFIYFPMLTQQRADGRHG